MLAVWCVFKWVPRLKRQSAVNNVDHGCSGNYTVTAFNGNGQEGLAVWLKIPQPNFDSVAQIDNEWCVHSVDYTPC